MTQYHHLIRRFRFLVIVVAAGWSVSTIGVARSFQIIIISTTYRDRSMPTTTTTTASPTSVAAVAAHGDDSNESKHHHKMFRNDPRSCIMQVGADAGRLCTIGNQLLVLPSTEDASDDSLTETLSDLFASLCNTAESLNLNWIRSIRSKMELNAKKYPVEHCKGKAGKYTSYSHLTGITTTNQSTMEFDETNSNSTTTADTIVVSLEDFANQHLQVLSDDIKRFAEDRLWTKYHKPRNLILALMGEVGELCELLQYEGDDYDYDELRLEPEKLDKLSQELADVSIYAIRLATVCSVVDGLRESLLLRQNENDGDAKQLFD